MGIATAVAAVGVAASAYGSKRSRDAAGRAAGQGDKLSDTQAQIAQETWDRYKKYYAPVEEKFVADVGKDLSRDYNYLSDRAQADVQQAYDNSELQLARKNQRFGFTPDSGTAQASANDLAIARAEDISGARTLARTRAFEQDEAKEYSRVLDALSLGKGMPAQASSMLGSAADRKYGQAAQAGESAGSWASMAGNILGSMKFPTQTPPITPSMPSGGPVGNSWWDASDPNLGLGLALP